ncbi:MAG: hypothetical protein HOP19_04745 [Acidobacteria bacterium]|nr:hypothetical protein [Acidobacteriota bacterium]
MAPINFLFDAMRRQQSGTGFLTPGFNPNAKMPDVLRSPGNNAPPIAMASGYQTPAPLRMTDGTGTDATTALATRPRIAPETESSTTAATAPASRPRYVEALNKEVGRREADAQTETMTTTATRPRIYFNDPIEGANYEYNRKDQRDRDAHPGWGNALKRIGKNAAVGFLHGASTGNLGEGLGGAAVGAVLSETKPEWASNLRFSTLYEPKMRRDEQYKFERERRNNALQLDEAKIGTEAARGENIKGQADEREKESRRKEAYNAAQIALRKAQEEATRHGRGVTSDIDDGQGGLIRVQVFPDGDVQVIGKSPIPVVEGQRAASRERISSGRNATNRANNAATNQTRERVAANRQGGKTPVAAPAKKVFPVADVSALAQKWGVNEVEAKRRLEISGYEVR